MKRFKMMLGLLALSAVLQNVKAMEMCDVNSYHDYEQTHNMVYTYDIYDIQEINVLHDMHKIEVTVKNVLKPEELALDEVFQIDIPPQIKIIRYNEKDVEFIEPTFCDDDIFDLGLGVYAMMRNDKVETLNAHKQCITDLYHVGVGLNTIDLQNVGVIGKGVFAYNDKLSEVTITAHNAGLVIDRFAFSNCGTIDDFKIFGDVKYISNNAFYNTHIKRLHIIGKKDENVCMTLFCNRNAIDTITWQSDDTSKTEMSEEEDY